MIASVYVETTVIGYLTARPSRDVVLQAHQQVTYEWWQTRRQNFELFISPLILQEAGVGDPELAPKRVEMLAELPVLESTREAIDLAEQLVRRGPLPEKAQVDALHIATATVHGMDYLLTWNLKHIANAAMRPRTEAVCRAAGYEPPVMCTPEELMEG